MNNCRLCKQILLSLSGLLLVIHAGYSQTVSEPSLVESTDRYEFYSNFWINMHHYLFKKAEHAENKPWREVFDDALLKNMNENEQEVLAIAIRYYKDHLIGKSLLFDDQLYWTKRALIHFDENTTLDHEAVDPGHQQVLNDSKNLYEKYFWSDHQDQNKLTLDEYLPLVRKIENKAFERLAELAQQPWPERKIRVDLSYYSNWAGAYTTTRPPHVVISTLEESSGEKWLPYEWVELLFHEPSHVIISPNNSIMGDKIKQVSTELGVDVPRDLWHAILFYFSGITVRDLLAGEGIDYELVMVSADIFSRYHSAVFEHMPLYIQGKVSLEEALEKTILRLQK